MDYPTQHGDSDSDSDSESDNEVAQLRLEIERLKEEREARARRDEQQLVELEQKVAARKARRREEKAREQVLREHPAVRAVVADLMARIAELESRQVGSPPPLPNPLTPTTSTPHTYTHTRLLGSSADGGMGGVMIEPRKPADPLPALTPQHRAPAPRHSVAHETHA